MQNASQAKMKRGGIRKTFLLRFKYVCTENHESRKIIIKRLMMKRFCNGFVTVIFRLQNRL